MEMLKKNKKTVTFNLSEETEKRINDIIKNNIYIKNFGHFTEICIWEYLETHDSKGNKREQYLDLG